MGAQKFGAQKMAKYCHMKTQKNLEFLRKFDGGAKGELEKICLFCLKMEDIVT